MADHGRPWQTMADRSQRGSRVPWGDLSLRCSTALLIYWGHSCHRTLLSSFWVIKIWPVPEQGFNLVSTESTVNPNFCYKPERCRGISTASPNPEANLCEHQHIKKLQETSQRMWKITWPPDWVINVVPACNLVVSCKDRGWQRFEVGSANSTVVPCLGPRQDVVQQDLSSDVRSIATTLQRWALDVVIPSWNSPHQKYQNTPQELWLRITAVCRGISCWRD